MAKKIISFIMTFGFLLCIWGAPLKSSSAENYSGVEVRMNQVIAQLKIDFPNGIFTDNQKICEHDPDKPYRGSCSHCNLANIYKAVKGVSWDGPGGASYTCTAFARYAFHEIFGDFYPVGGVSKIGPANIYESYANLRQGDYIHSQRSDGSHTMIFLAADETGITVLDANSAKLRQISYTHKIMYNDKKLNGILYYYRSKNYEAVNKAYCPHDFSNLGYCKNCGADFMDVAVKVSPICNKLVTTQDSPIRSRPYAESSAILVTVPSNQTIYSTGCLDNHWAGHLWYLVTYNGATGYIYKNNVTVADNKKTFLLAFNANGGSGAPESFTAFCAEKTTLPAAEPNKNGSTFQGWATYPHAFLPQFTSGGTYSIFAKANEQITLYAVWGTSFFGSSTETATPLITAGPTAHVCTYGSDGYCIVCGKEYPCAVTPNSAVYRTVKEGVPIWSRPYSSSSARMDQTENVVISKGEQFTVDASVVNCLGNIWYRIVNGRFNGCYIYSENVELSTNGNTKTPPPSPASTPAPLPSSAPAATQFTLYFDANGGNGVPSASIVSAGSGFVIPGDEPLWNGYRFVGWSEYSDVSSASASSIYYGGSLIIVDRNITLYAIWEPDSSGSVSSPATVNPEPSIAYAGGSTSNDVGIYLNVPYLLAGDFRWSSLKLGSSSYTVGKSGGFITCMAMYESYRLGTEETPATLINSGRAKFSSDGGLLFSCDLYKPYKGADFSMQTIYDLLSDNKPVVVWANNGGKHYAVLCYGFEGDPSNMELSDFSIYDPLNGTSMLSDWSDFSRICYYP